MGPKTDAPYVIPHYSTFKNTKGLPQIEELEKALAQKGLKDPWIRNETWRYHPSFGTKMKRALTFFFRGLPLGLGLTILTVAAEKVIGGDAHGGHGGHGDH